MTTWLIFTAGVAIGVGIGATVTLIGVMAWAWHLGQRKAAAQATRPVTTSAPATTWPATSRGKH